MGAGHGVGGLWSAQRLGLSCGGQRLTLQVNHRFKIKRRQQSAGRASVRSKPELASAYYAADLCEFRSLPEYRGSLDVKIAVSKFGKLVCGATGTMLSTERMS